jgi:hypothetical protein
MDWTIATLATKKNNSLKKKEKKALNGDRSPFNPTVGRLK